MGRCSCEHCREQDAPFALQSCATLVFEGVVTLLQLFDSLPIESTVRLTVMRVRIGVVTDRLDLVRRSRTSFESLVHPHVDAYRMHRVEHRTRTCPFAIAVRMTVDELLLLDDVRRLGVSREIRVQVVIFVCHSFQFRFQPMSTDTNDSRSFVRYFDGSPFGSVVVECTLHCIDLIECIAQLDSHAMHIGRCRGETVGRTSARRSRDVVGRVATDNRSFAFQL
jgi:hypothetical protein